jgi:IclR family transcriptional regulator, acetate operon repressor
MNNPGAQAVDRAAQLLTLVVEHGDPVSFTELVEYSGLTRSTTSRLLAALEANYLLERDVHGAFSAGALFGQYAARHDPNSQLARVAASVLRTVGAETGETVNLAVARGETVIQVAQVEATFVLGARDWMHVTVPPHCSALGKALYAYAALPLPTGDLEQLTAHSLATAGALRREVAVIRRRGYALTREELEIGLDAVAVPVHGPDGSVVAALGVSGPSTRLGPKLDEVGCLLTEHGSALSHLLNPRVRTKGVA